MNILELLQSGSEVLKFNKIKTHQLDSEVVLSNLLKEQRENLIVNSDQRISETNILNFKKLIARRANKEPLAYILKNKEFWSTDFFVDRSTLIPRPETELLCENIIKIFKNKDPYILDIGTGSGCIVLSILTELRRAKGVGIDISRKAIDIAKKNSSKIGLNKRVKFLTKSIESINDYKFDLIVSNPPYIKTADIKNLTEDVKRFEPKIALDGGKDGLDVIKKVIYKSNTILKKSGWLALEIGYGQHYKVSQILKKKDFREELLVKDYKNNIRCIIARFKN
jgi:release factor glutamine methyltransferase